MTANRYAGTDNASAWAQGYQYGQQNPSNSNPTAPSPYADDSATVWQEGALAGQQDAQSHSPAPDQTQTSAPAAPDSGPNTCEGPAYTPAPQPIPQTDPNQTIETPADQTAYQIGYLDGKAGNNSDPIGRVGFRYAQDYLTGYSDGQLAKTQEQSTADLPPYSGPSVGLPGEPAEEEQEGPEKPEGFDEPWPWSLPEAGRYTYLRNTIAQAQRDIAFGLSPAGVWGRTGLTHGDIGEYERLFEIFGSSDPNAEPIPTNFGLPGEEEPELVPEEGEGE